MSSLHNVELFALPTSTRSKYYVGILANWQEEFECWRVLVVRTPPVIAYCSDVVIQDGGGAPTTCHISITEYVVIAILRFRAAARDGAVSVACIDPQMGGYSQGVLVLLPSSAHCGVDSNGLFEVCVVLVSIMSPC